MAKKILQKGRKHCGKRRNFSYRAISPFPTVFSKDLYCRYVKTKGLLRKVLKGCIYCSSVDGVIRVAVNLLKAPIAPNWKGVCLQNTNKSRPYHLKIWQLL